MIVLIPYPSGLRSVWYVRDIKFAIRDIIKMELVLRCASVLREAERDAA